MTLKSHRRCSGTSTLAAGLLQQLCSTTHCPPYNAALQPAHAFLCLVTSAFRLCVHVIDLAQTYICYYLANLGHRKPWTLLITRTCSGLLQTIKYPWQLLASCKHPPAFGVMTKTCNNCVSKYCHHPKTRWCLCNVSTFETCWVKRLWIQ